MKNIILIIGLSILSLANILAQEEAHYSHFMYNQLLVNPAYAGSKEAIHLTGIYRNQWIGVEGAPENINFNFDTPLFNDRTGIGLSLISDKIGWNKNIYADLAYAYRIKVSRKAHLALGIKGRLSYNRLSWSDADPFQEEDGEIPITDQNSIKPNFGVGAFYNTDKYYIGISAPTLLKTNLYNSTSSSATGYRKQVSYYMNLGAMLGKGRRMMIFPSAMLSLNPSAPFELDLNVSFIFDEKVWLGVSSRLGDSIDCLLGYQLTRQLRASAAVDFTTSQLRKKSFGSVEIMLEYTVKCCGKKMNNIRFF